MSAGSYRESSGHIHRVAEGYSRRAGVTDGQVICRSQRVTRYLCSGSVVGVIGRCTVCSAAFYLYGTGSPAC